MDEKEKQDISMDGIRNKNVQQWHSLPLLHIFVLEN